MTFDSALLDFMTTTVTYADHASLSLGGAQTFSTASVTVRARIEPGSKLVRDQTGREVVSEVTVFLEPTGTTGTTFMPNVKGRITLPSPYDPTTPPIIRVRIHNDAESQGGGVHHYEVNL